ncbi:selenocysteine-specific translation elongation factor [Rudaeicoccus suwonensis]|uniref:Selenocysteine-specific elongation factor n=1 Tax=Rudaeicoccus suwonensis TaxID=657409 RepID=A0A561E9Q4_9MICO|nr:selenocysteine-specific translation elongation factor [Rudaeicoccus suwonensis]TWE12331.1 selenocysteine-specific elongation factor [Rudaeicoccus suwonensis]
MHVIATAGHVDHGKSTLVRALTGTEPDRWAEEQRRGLTIDLGFAWLTTPSGREAAFVDVPGHERFIGNMLAGLGPVPVVCFIVAADEGWRAQSAEHADAIAALGIQHGLVVISRCDLAPDRVTEVMAEARAGLTHTGLRDAPVVGVSAVTGTGMDDLRRTLDQVLARVPRPAVDDRVRMWLDRSFSINGAGTVVTGTLAGGTLAVGQQLDLASGEHTYAVTIRGLQRHGQAHDRVGPVSRVAVNLRGRGATEIHRGDVLISPGAWPWTATVDVRRVSGVPLDEVPVEVIAHVGTAAIPGRLRSFTDRHARLTFTWPVPVVHADRIVLRHPGSRRVLGGVQVADADPPALGRRGDAARRGQVLAQLPAAGDLGYEVRRRGAVRQAHLVRLNLTAPHADPPDGIRAVGEWWIDGTVFAAWVDRLRDVVAQHHTEQPLSGGLTTSAVRDRLGMPDTALVPEVAAVAGLRLSDGLISDPAREASLGRAEPGITAIEARLTARPFDAPETDDLIALGIGARELAAAERLGRLLRLDDGVVLLPSTPALAMRELSRLPQPFTTSEARQALSTTRRIVIPLLEHLDRRGWTRRTDAQHRVVVR